MFNRKITKGLIVMMMIMGLAFTMAVMAIAAPSKGENKDTTSVSQTNEEKSFGDSAVGMGLIAAALVTGLAGVGSGIAIAASAPAAIGATSENPKNFGKSLIFVALGESIVLFGVVVSVLVLKGIGML